MSTPTKVQWGTLQDPEWGRKEYDDRSGTTREFDRNGRIVRIEAGDTVFVPTQAESTQEDDYADLMGPAETSEYDDLFAPTDPPPAPSTDDASPFEGASAGADAPEINKPPRPEWERTARGAMANALAGATFNWADELAGNLAQSQAVTNAIIKGEKLPDPEKTYAKARNTVRELQQDFSDKNPKTALGLSVAGGMLTGGAVATKGGSAAVRYTPNVAEGMLAGAGVVDEAEDMGTGAVLGGALGAATKYAGGVLSRRFGPYFERLGLKGAEGQVRAVSDAADQAEASVTARVDALRRASAEEMRIARESIAALERPLPEGKPVPEAVRELMAERSRLARMLAENPGIDPDGKIAEFLKTPISAIQHYLPSMARDVVDNSATERLAMPEAERLRVASKILATASLPEDQQRALSAAQRYMQAQQGASGEIEKGAQAILDASAFKESVKSGLGRAATAGGISAAGAGMGYGIGAMVDKDNPSAREVYPITGAVLGAAIGGALSGKGPAAWKAVASAATHPAVRLRFWGAVQRVADADPAFRRIVGQLSGPTMRSPQVLSQTLQALSGAPGFGDFISAVGKEEEKGLEGATDLEAVSALLDTAPETLGANALPLAKAKQEGRLKVAHYVLQQKDPQYRATLEAAKKGDTSIFQDVKDGASGFAWGLANGAKSRLDRSPLVNAAGKAGLPTPTPGLGPLEPARAAAQEASPWAYEVGNVAAPSLMEGGAYPELGYRYAEKFAGLDMRPETYINRLVNMADDKWRAKQQKR